MGFWPLSKPNTSSTEKGYAVGGSEHVLRWAMGHIRAHVHVLVSTRAISTMHSFVCSKVSGPIKYLSAIESCSYWSNYSSVKLAGVFLWLLNSCMYVTFQTCVRITCIAYKYVWYARVANRCQGGCGLRGRSNETNACQS